MNEVAKLESASTVILINEIIFTFHKNIHERSTKLPAIQMKPVSSSE